ncbi:DUF1622 domain-containing protein [Micromonospora sp. WMMD998]|uniref:DUF1622 domain-containing protein n=1 Tax=Micromonospora sp. WMMD998 TaxID=3016092 RepID=UPI00249A8C5F|nr:DUF1622 domain-containing protein [Micromonospora sp. WMMD998]WFE39825.1 DUF1622 domain-containing protein [Micromonospora sp. WMMD998]
MDDVLGEEWLSHSVDLLVRLVETAGALIIFVGAMTALVRFVVVGLRDRRTRAFVPVRLGLGRFLALGLEFQLASDILRTAIAPTLREIGELAAVAAIRTALNFFLAREIRQERAELARSEGRATPDPVDEPAGRPS